MFATSMPRVILLLPLFGTAAGTPRFWALDNGQATRSFEGHLGQVDPVARSADGRRALTGGADGTARLWDLEGGQALRTLEGHRKEVTTVALSADGRRALTGSADGTARLWDLEDGQAIRTFECDGGRLSKWVAS